MSRALAFVLAAVMLLGGCAPQERRSAARGLSDGDVPIDTQVMAYLSEARALHHVANLAEDDDVPRAIAALDELTRAARPHPGDRVPEIEDVLADTFARKAELQVRQGDLAKAAESAKEGLTHAPGPGYFRGHLLEVEGTIEEARAAQLRDAGQPAAAAEAKARAFDLLHQAVLVQERFVNESLPGDAMRQGGGR